MQSSVWILNAILIVFAVVVLSILGLYWTRNQKVLKAFHDHHDVSGFTFGIIGVVYAVLLGYTVVTVQERFNNAYQEIMTESNNVMDLYRDVEAFDVATRTKIRGLIVGYIKLVLDDEWVKMANLEASDATAAQVRKIWAAYAEIQPKDQRETVWLEQSLSKLNEFSSTRLLRIFHGYESLGPMMWTLLAMGACITIGFIYLFHVEPFWLHAIMTGLLAGLIAFMLFLIGELDRAYTGTVKVTPVSIEKVQQILEKWERG